MHFIWEKKLFIHRVVWFCSIHSHIYGILYSIWSFLFVFLHNSYGIQEFPSCENFVGVDWGGNPRWDNIEPYLQFRWVHTEPSVYSRKANKEPSMHFRKANTEPSMYFGRDNTESVARLDKLSARGRSTLFGFTRFTQ